MAECIRAQKQLKVSDECVEDAVLSWYEEEKDMALLLSRNLGILVKSSPKNKETIKKDISRLVKDNYINGSLTVKDSVSNIKISAEFERRMVSMSVKVTPPMDKGTVARISWIARQLDNCRKKSEDTFNSIESNIWIEADIKFAKANLKIKLTELSELSDQVNGKEIQAFHIVVSNSFGPGFASNKKFITLIEQMLLDYYEGIVQHMINWNRPAPKLN